MVTSRHTLDPTTQGPLYPPSEIMSANGDFIVVGKLPEESGAMPWGGAIVSARTRLPPYGQVAPYTIVQRIDLDDLKELSSLVFYTLPLPLPVNNYPMLFAPEQRPSAHFERRPSYPLHQAPVPDARPGDGRRPTDPITLGQWMTARGYLDVTVSADERSARFDFEFEHLVADSLYTVMALRQHDLNPERPTRPGPLGIPNAFVTDSRGRASFWAELPDPFPSPQRSGANRLVNIVVLYMSAQMSYGGAIGLFGLGGDIHAQLKFKEAMFQDLRTRG
jgi:hypothetical protein